LRVWLARLVRLGVTFEMRHRWIGWNERGDAEFVLSDSMKKAAAFDATILAFGGASWPRLGSDGSWSGILRQSGIACAPLRPANCGFHVEWRPAMQRHEGQPLKRIALDFAGHSVRGEAIVTRSGLEGGAIYAMSSTLRDAIDKTGHAVVTIDLRPDLSSEEIERRLAAPRGKQSLSTFLRKTISLAPVAIGLAQEATHGKLAAMSPTEMAALLKAVPVRLTGVAPVEWAISTAGGVLFDEVNDRFMLRRRPGVFVAGEMLDWEAPTGGYLLQASFATGAAAGRGALAWLSSRSR
jgi:uncharacterized flavoprotein (TIGR03862 family)